MISRPAVGLPVPTGPSCFVYITNGRAARRPDTNKVGICCSLRLCVSNCHCSRPAGLARCVWPALWWCRRWRFGVGQWPPAAGSQVASAFSRDRRAGARARGPAPAGRAPSRPARPVRPTPSGASTPLVRPWRCLVAPRCGRAPNSGQRRRDIGAARWPVTTAREPAGLSWRMWRARSRRLASNFALVCGSRAGPATLDELIDRLGRQARPLGQLSGARPALVASSAGQDIEN